MPGSPAPRRPPPTPQHNNTGPLQHNNTGPLQHKNISQYNTGSQHNTSRNTSTGSNNNNINNGSNNSTNSGVNCTPHGTPRQRKRFFSQQMFWILILRFFWPPVFFNFNQSQVDQQPHGWLASPVHGALPGLAFAFVFVNLFVSYHLHLYWYIYLYPTICVCICNFICILFLTTQVMRYSPYVTYGHQGLTLGQNPAQALSGNLSTLNSQKQFRKRDASELLKTSWNSEPKLKLKLHQSTDTSCGDYAVPLAPAHYSDTDSDLERTEDYVFLQVGQDKNTCSPDLLVHRSTCLDIFHFFRSQHWPLFQAAWAQGGFLKLGRTLSNSTPFYPRYQKQVFFWSKYI